MVLLHRSRVVPWDWAAKLITATGTTRDNPAVHFFVAHRGQMFPKKDWEKWGQYEMFTVTNHLVRRLSRPCNVCNATIILAWAISASIIFTA